jgi:hypothetical protein
MSAPRPRIHPTIRPARRSGNRGGGITTIGFPGFAGRSTLPRPAEGVSAWHIVSSLYDWRRHLLGCRRIFSARMA